MKRKIYTTLAILFLLLPTVYGQQKESIATLSCIVLEEKNDTLFFGMDILLSADAPGSNRMIRIQPSLSTADGRESFIFPSVGKEGKKREQLHRRKVKFNKNKDEAISSFTYRMTDTIFLYRFTFPYQLWMDDAVLDIKEIVNGCAGSEQVYTFTDLPPIYIHSLIPYIPSPVVEFYEPIQEVKQRSVEKTAYVDFQVGKSLIVPTFKRNPQELPKITETIREVSEDRDVTITRIDITGFASPDGPYRLNEKLSEQRTLVLKNYIRDRSGLNEELFKTNSIAEDWDGFEEMVYRNDLPEKERILAIISSDKEPDQKEQELKKLGAVYRTILNDLFPDLRRTIYRIGYTVRDYSVDEVEVLISKQPENLSPFEFYQIAKHSEKGSEKWNEVILKTVEYNPDDAVSNINAAAVLLSSGDYKAALPHLEKAANDPRVHNNMAVYYLLAGDPDKAEEHLKKDRTGNKELINKNLWEMEQLRHSLNRIQRKNRN